MSKFVYIDAPIDKYGELTVTDAISMIGTKIPSTIDIVFCKECKNFRPNAYPLYERCKHFWADVDDDDFCAYGERSE